MTCVALFVHGVYACVVLCCVPMHVYLRTYLQLERYPLEELLVANLSAQSWTRLRAIADVSATQHPRNHSKSCYHVIIPTSDYRHCLYYHQSATTGCGLIACGKLCEARGSVAVYLNL